MSRDAGLALNAYLIHVVSQPKVLPALLAQLGRPKLKAIELGSGCGTVGLQIARLYPNSEVLLTDLADGMTVLDYNISKARCANRKSRVTSAVLDWDNGPHETIDRARRFDLIVVSDCTYNADSLPALVRTIGILFEVSPAALLIVSMKIRHESEAIFHDLIAGAQLEQINHSVVPLPDKIRDSIGQPVEEAHIYLYRLRNDD